MDDLLIDDFDTDHLRFHEAVPDNPNLKTKIVLVMKPDGFTKLGEIKWYGPWRQYAFFPSAATIFNNTCLQTITEAVQRMNQWQRFRQRVKGGNLRARQVTGTA